MHRFVSTKSLALDANKLRDSIPFYINVHFNYYLEIRIKIKNFFLNNRFHGIIIRDKFCFFNINK